MKILVTVKRVPDPELRPKFKGPELDLSSVSWVVNTFDEYAVETALRLVENGATSERAGEVVVLSIGPKESGQQLRSCLAMGADRGILVDATDAALDSDVVARIVQAVVEREKPDLLLMGKQAVDGDSNQVGQLVAGLCGWPQATFAATIALAADEKSVTVGREVDAGLETKRIPLPGVVTVDLRSVMPRSVSNARTPETHAWAEGARYASLKGIMAAKKKPIEELTPAALGVTMTPRVKVVSVEAPPARKAGIKVKDIAELVQRLHDEAKVI
ncbi:MAG: electron transfer flavoprotein subunit beta/FixA family protein [Myxococcales bacterium]|nr:electron transfer flavoprotein subunit beta/FixA family protein [Myxococcales bacterium]